MRLKIDLNKPDEIRTGLAILTALMPQKQTPDGADKKIVKEVKPSKDEKPIVKDEKLPDIKKVEIITGNQLNDDMKTSEVTIEGLRAKTQVKIAAGFRDAIKAKLKEVNTNAVSNLKPELWNDFDNFLNTLD